MISMTIKQVFDVPEVCLPFFEVIGIFFVTVVIVFVCVFFKFAFTRWSLSCKLPGKSNRLFNVLGNISDLPILKKELFNAGILQLIGGYSELFKNEDVFIFWISYVPFLVIVKAKALEELIAGTRTLKKGWTYQYLHPWLGTGLLTSDGVKWKSRRKLLTPSFHFDILKDFLPVFNEQSQILVELLQKEVSKESTDIIMPITLCSLDIICETTLGVKIGAQRNKDSQYVQAVLRAAKIIAERMTNCKYWLNAIFHFTEVGKQLKEDLKLLHDFTRSVIREKKHKLLSGDPEALLRKRRKALMDILLEHHVETKNLTEEDIREEVDTFTFEGHDTTSMGMSWALYLIGLYQDVQEKLHEEMDRIFGDDTDRAITTDDIKDMKYLDCVLKESQRLYPSVPFIAREATEEIKICGYTIPKGTQCAAMIYFLHRDESVFPNSEKFDPDRFLPENSVNRHPYAYVPFSAGPRNCIGQRFAVMEEKVVVSNILRNYSLESLDPRDKIIPASELILRPAEPIRIRIRPREFEFC